MLHVYRVSTTTIVQVWEKWNDNSHNLACTAWHSHFMACIASCSLHGSGQVTHHKPAASGEMACAPGSRIQTMGYRIQTPCTCLIV